MHDHDPLDRRTRIEETRGAARHDRPEVAPRLALALPWARRFDGLQRGKNDGRLAVVHARHAIHAEGLEQTHEKRGLA